MSLFIDETGTPQPERRQQAQLRDIFDDVVRLVQPYFLPGTGLNGQHPDFWVSRTIRDTYPDLTSQDVQVLTSAAARYYRENGAGGTG
ncbi:MAG: hypothetical protein B7Y41_12905 [Hydrogenophilales bacterium 28-61-23]|nr:MAG: hypothetical protein B7Y41_12905 [Hydrogenophilales bacterium 28-61-23]